MWTVSLGRTGIVAELSGSQIRFYGNYVDQIYFKNEKLAAVWFETMVDLTRALPDFTL